MSKQNDKANETQSISDLDDMKVLEFADGDHDKQGWKGVELKSHDAYEQIIIRPIDSSHRRLYKQVEDMERWNQRRKCKNINCSLMRVPEQSECFCVIAPPDSGVKNEKDNAPNFGYNACIQSDSSFVPIIASKGLKIAMDAVGILVHTLLTYLAKTIVAQSDDWMQSANGDNIMIIECDLAQSMLCVIETESFVRFELVAIGKPGAILAKYGCATESIVSFYANVRKDVVSNICRRAVPPTTFVPDGIAHIVQQYGQYPIDCNVTYQRTDLLSDPLASGTIFDAVDIYVDSNGDATVSFIDGNTVQYLLYLRDGNCRAQEIEEDEIFDDCIADCGYVKIEGSETPIGDFDLELSILRGHIEQQARFDNIFEFLFGIIVGLLGITTWTSADELKEFLRGRRAYFMQ